MGSFANFRPYEGTVDGSVTITFVRGKRQGLGKGDI
jgi:hypothetical protein